MITQRRAGTQSGVVRMHDIHSTARRESDVSGAALAARASSMITQRRAGTQLAEMHCFQWNIMETPRNPVASVFLHFFQLRLKTASFGTPCVGKILPDNFQNFYFSLKNVRKPTSDSPETIPRRSQNYPKIIPKQFPDDPKTVPKLSQNDPQTTPK